MNTPGTSGAVPPAVGKSPSLGRGLKNILDLLMKVVENFGAVLLAAMTVVICWEVFGRFFAKYINGINSPWTEEVATVMMVWFGLTGAAIGIRKSAHIGVEFVMNLFHKKVGRVMMIVVGLITLAFSVFLLVAGYNSAIEMVGVDLTATGLSRGYVVFMAMPVAAALMIIYTLEAIVKNIIILFTKGGEEE